MRLGDERIYRWEFQGPDGEFAVPINSKFTIDETRAMLALGLQGVGLIDGREAVFAPYDATGELNLVLEDWATKGNGYHIYYPSRRQVPTGLRLLTDLIREMRPLNL